MKTFGRGDLTLSYSEHGNPAGIPIVLTHGLLLSSAVQERVARLLGDARVLLLDLHGHGRSDQPADPARYTWAEMVADVVGLLDHLDIDRAVLGGHSLGANVALAAALDEPDRVRGLVLEMPVLARGSAVAGPLYTAVAHAYRTGRPVLGPIAAVARRLPAVSQLPEARAALDLARRRPEVAEAVLRGLLAEPPVGADDDRLARIDVPALVLGHRHDPLHPLDDARRLASCLPAARLVEAPSIVSHRIRPDRLAAEIAAFAASLDGDP